MTPQTIIETNTQIAIFDGYIFVKGEPIHVCGKHDKNLEYAGCSCHMKHDRLKKDYVTVYPDSLNYHTDWNSLMKVAGRLNQYLIKGTGSLIPTDNVVERETAIRQMDNAFTTYDIEEAYQAFVAALDFYDGYSAHKER